MDWREYCRVKDHQAHVVVYMLSLENLFGQLAISQDESGLTVQHWSPNKKITSL
jgi:hypothetical protein